MRVPLVIQLVYSFGFNLVYRTLPAYLSTLTSSAVQISLVHTAYNGASVAKAALGVAADRAGKKRAILASFLAVIFIALSLTLATSIVHFIVLFLLLGLTAGVYYSSIGALVADLSERKTEALFRLESAYQLGFVLGPLIGGFLALHYGMVAAFWVWAGLGALGFGLSLLLPPKKGERKPGRFLTLLLQRRLLLVLAVGSALTGFAQAVLDLAVPLYATSLGMDIAAVGMIFAGSALLNVVAMLVLGKRLERVGERVSLFVMLLLIGLPFLAFPLAASLPALVVLVGLASIGRAAGLNLARTFLARRVGPESSATAMGTCDTLHYVGRVAGPLAAGVIIDFGSFSLLFFGMGAVTIIAALIFLAAAK
ncbi:MAG: MFS transporter [Candidatus Aenigmarchaeota archaeon]|nr:MFS transporter [Candidatus Aenigmarchaeota archaeon]